MKSTISPDIWETKRMLITKLYKDEEWPLKQVIKLVQTRDFHPSESQLRSRLKKWHITKPSRKKYDGSRRLSGAKKNAQKSQQSSLPSSSTYHTLHSQPQSLSQQRKLDETDSLSDGRSEASRPSVSVPEMSISPANRYILPSSPQDDLGHVYGSNPIIPSTPITPAVYGMDEAKRNHSTTTTTTATTDPQTIYFYPTESSPPFQHVPVSYPHFFDPALAAVAGPDYLSGSYNGVQYVPGPSHPYKEPGDGYGLPDLPPPLLDGSVSGAGTGSSSGHWVNHSGYGPPSPSGVYTRPSHGHGHGHSHPYFHEDVPIAPAIYQM